MNKEEIQQFNANILDEIADLYLKANTLCERVRSNKDTCSSDVVSAAEKLKEDTFICLLRVCHNNDEAAHGIITRYQHFLMGKRKSVFSPPLV